MGVFWDFEGLKKWIYPKRARFARAFGSRKARREKGNIPQGAPAARLRTESFCGIIKVWHL